MNNFNIIKLSDRPELAEKAALWFSSKWGVSKEAYLESIQSSIKNKNCIPIWYTALDKNDEIIAGAGVIENDFHDRKDLSPNLCALFVEEPYRKQKIARHILDFARQDLKKIGFENLYLVTDHTQFYEKCGWEFLVMVKDDNGAFERMYFAPTV